MHNALSSSVLAKKLETFFPLSPAERMRLADIQSNPLKVKRGKRLTEEGQTGHKVFVLHAGWACSYKELSNGQRQIISFPIAGDIVGLRSVLLKIADHCEPATCLDADRHRKPLSSINLAGSIPDADQQDARVGPRKPRWGSSVLHSRCLPRFRCGTAPSH
jgi:CRP-like cAMP-binding protein